MGSWKLETDVEPDGLPRFLRDLADVLESGQGAGELAGMPRLDAARGLRKLVLVAAAQDDGFALTLKAKRGHEIRVLTKKTALPQGVRPDPKASDAEDRLREKYRQLKKAMQADYKALRKAAEAGRMPAQDVLESFLALGESMTNAAASKAAWSEPRLARPTPLTGDGALRRQCARGPAVVVCFA